MESWVANYLLNISAAPLELGHARPSARHYVIFCKSLYFTCLVVYFGNVIVKKENTADDLVNRHNMRFIDNTFQIFQPCMRSNRMSLCLSFLLYETKIEKEWKRRLSLGAYSIVLIKAPTTVSFFYFSSLQYLWA